MANQPPKEGAPADKLTSQEEHQRWIDEMFVTNAPTRPSPQEEAAARKKEEEARKTKELKDRLTKFQPSILNKRGKANTRARGRGNTRGNLSSGRGGMATTPPTSSSVGDATTGQAHTDSQHPAENASTNELDSTPSIPQATTPAEPTATDLTIVEGDKTGNEWFKDSLMDEDNQAEWDRQANMHKRSAKQNKKADEKTNTRKDQPFKETSYADPYDVEKGSESTLWEGSFLTKQFDHSAKMLADGEKTMEEDDEHYNDGDDPVSWMTHPKWGVLPDTDEGRRIAWREVHEPAALARERNGVEPSDGQDTETETATLALPAPDCDIDAPPGNISNPTSNTNAQSTTQTKFATGEDAFLARQAIGQPTSATNEDAASNNFNGVQQVQVELASPTPNLGAGGVQDYMTDQEIEQTLGANTDNQYDSTMSSPPKKAKKFNAAALLAKQGYEEGKGLGKDLSGNARFIHHGIDKKATKAAGGRIIGKIRDSNKPRENASSTPSLVVRFSKLLQGHTIVPSALTDGSLEHFIAVKMTEKCGRVKAIRAFAESSGGRNHVYVEFVDGVSALSAVSKDGCQQADLGMSGEWFGTNEEVSIDYYDAEAFAAGELY